MLARPQNVGTTDLLSKRTSNFIAWFLRRPFASSAGRVGLSELWGLASGNVKGIFPAQSIVKSSGRLGFPHGHREGISKMLQWLPAAYCLLPKLSEEGGVSKRSRSNSALAQKYDNPTGKAAKRKPTNAPRARKPSPNQTCPRTG